MKLSWRWLSEYVDLTDLAVDAVAERLTALGLEVESIERLDPVLDGVVVGEIMAAEPHPDADKLQVCDVEFGGVERMRIVCGAPNARPGIKVPFAQVGAELPGGFKISARKVRGVPSSGMLCSESELGLSQDHGGLWELDGATPGEPIETVLKRERPERFDTIVELGITPNRGDCLSYVGIAREIAAAFDRELRMPQITAPAAGAEGPAVAIRDGVSCPRYSLTVLRGVRVGPSPAWLRTSVEASGARSVNNVVDVTNFVLFELGQPQHAFDAARLSGDVVVRRAADGESLVAIDHDEYALAESDLVIADSSGAIAIAGVMGGASTEVGETTTDIALECAYFDPSAVRLTAKRLGLHSESSHRFERGVDPNGIPLATRRAIDLIQRTQETPATVGPTTDVYPAPIARPNLKLRAGRVSALLGIALPAEDIAKMLRGIGLESTLDGATLNVAIPSWRFDLEREVDLIEEVARMWGVDNVPAVLPTGQLGHVHRRRSEPVAGRRLVSETIVSGERLRRVQSLRTALRAGGCHEAVHFSFIDPAQVAALRFDDEDVRRTPVAVRNPMSVEQSVLRTSLVPGLLAAVARNQAQQASAVSLFEVGRAFWRTGEDSLVDDSGVEEPRMLGIALYGSGSKGWRGPSTPANAYAVKGLLEGAAEALGVSVTWGACDDSVAPYLHPGVRLGVKLDGRVIGALGEVHPSVVASVPGLSGPVYAAEIRADGLFERKVRPVQLEQLPRFPGSSRDLAIVVSETVPFSQVARAVKKARPKLLESWRIFDVYTGKGIAEGEKSLALNFVYRDPKAHDAESGRTLTDAEVQQAHDALVTALEKSLGATRR